MVSCYDHAEQVQKARDLGIYDYLIKPVNIDRLIPIFKEVFDY